MGATKMTYNCLGQSGLRVSSVCLGAANFGSWENFLPGNCDEELSHAILDRFVEKGGNFIDTSDIYAHGKSEEIIGNWMSSQDRGNIVLATKVAIGKGTGPNSSGLSRHHILQGVEESLKRLKTSYIDVYLMHVWDEGTPIEETLATLNDLVRVGKVRYLGGSNLTGWQLQKIASISHERGWAPFIALEQQYSLLRRETEFELVDVCRNEGIGLLPWGPLKGGFLTGKFRKGEMPPEGSRIRHGTDHPKASQLKEPIPSYQQLDNDQTWAILDELGNIAKAYGRPVSQVALKWLLQQQVVPSVVVGCKTVQQLQENIGASDTDWQLTPDQMQRLDSVSAVPVPYPYNYSLQKIQAFKY